jgi:MFS family permease
VANLDPSALREAPVRRLILAQLTSITGDGMVLVALPFAVYGIGGSNGQVGVALATQSLAMALLILLGGAIGDRFNRRSVVVAADLLRFGARAAIAVLLVLGDATYWQILLAQVAHGAGSAFFRPAMDSLVPEVVRSEQRKKANALRKMAESLGWIVGAALGAAILVAGHPGWAFTVDAATFLASALLVKALATPFASLAEEPDEYQGIRVEVAEGWAAVRGLGWFWRVALEFAVLNTLVFAPFFVFGPAVAAQSLGGAEAWALILTGLAVGELLGGAFAMKWQPAHPLSAATTVVAFWIAPLVLLATTAPVGLIAIGAVFAGASVTVFETLWETAKQDHSPPQLLSRLNSFDQLGSFGLVPLGYLLGGLMLGAVGASAALFAGAAILAVATFSVATDPSIRRIKPGAVQGRGGLALAAGK